MKNKAAVARMKRVVKGNSLFSWYGVWNIRTYSKKISYKNIIEIGFKQNQITYN